MVEFTVNMCVAHAEAGRYFASECAELVTNGMSER